MLWFSEHNSYPTKYVQADTLLDSDGATTTGAFYLYPHGNPGDDIPSVYMAASVHVDSNGMLVVRYKPNKVVPNEIVNAYYKSYSIELRERRRGSMDGKSLTVAYSLKVEVSA